MKNTNTDILISGAFAAFTIDLLVYPLDTIKTRIQSPDFRKRYTDASTGTVNRYLFRGLYQGIGSVILATVPSSGAFFTTYEASKSVLASTSLPLPLAHALASATGECVSCLILTPAEVLKQNAQMVSSRLPPSQSNKMFDRNATMVALRKFNSPSQLWRGYTALTGRNLPFTAMQFPLFEHLRDRLHAWRRREGVATGSLWETGLVTGLAAGTSGTLAAVLTTPIDVVKTRIMLTASDSESSSKHIAARKEMERQGMNVDKEKERLKDLKARKGRTGGIAIGREILRTEGIKGLFRGGALRGLWTALGSGLYLGVYESGRRWLEDRREREGDAISG